MCESEKLEQRGREKKITIDETVEEWFARKEALAEQLVEDWLKNKIPILVVVEENTANALQCVLGDCIRKLSIKRHIRPFPQIHLAHHFETHLIENFEEKHKVVREYDEWLKSSKSKTTTT